ncbi:AI-2E family transporter [Leucobacter sp. UT-8R-CII-1-4]|uniref:AI-2E family transporter n=1 Tax=Leucobacter sp. UT-8R-CII-1-4 TaxID=3040075 RepID=UPI0024A85ECE|nr:AI-2E family transporter [Leucobacter sp. UT-8R-CII-1-4]MDI6023348.1 AI-2E family transporter [Leucobacter sp. UT-8R-CII-1-4]
MKNFFPSRRKTDVAVESADQSEQAETVEAHPDVVRVNLERLDAETRAMYRDSEQALATESEQQKAKENRTREFVVQGPFRLGFTITLGVLAAILVGQMFGQLSVIIMYVVGGLFIALALDPLVTKLERHGIKRPMGIAIVFASFILIVGGILAIVIPMIANQIAVLITTAPKYFVDVQHQEWYLFLQERFGNFVDFGGLLETAQNLIGKPENWAQLAGGVWQAGIGIANGLTATIVVLILSLYFLSSLQATKRAFYSVIARSKRAKVIDITEQITASVGGYVNGMVLLALINSVLGFIMMSIVSVPFAGLVAVGVFLLALIPLIGSVLATVLVSVVALFNSPTTALIAAVYYLIYMQLESYVLTPRVMNRVVSVPGALVVIGALAGGTLLGLLGALISIPVTAMVLMIIKQVWVPRQDTQ